MIRAENIYKSFGKQNVLKDISFIFLKGKTNLKIGKTGAGKTVPLKILVACNQENYWTMNKTMKIHNF